MASYRQNPRTAGRVIDGLAFVVTPHDNRLHTLNATGTVIWSLADQAVSLDDLAAGLTRRFAVDAERARADAAAFCADLVARGILEEAA
jgi:hypothetical protein